MTLKQRMFREFLIAFLVGALPISISYYYGGLTLLKEVVENIAPGRLLLGFQFFLLIPFAVFVFIEHYILPRTDSGKQVLIFFRSIFHEAAAGVIGLWRMLAGAILGYFGVWLFNDPETLTALKVFALVGIPFALLVESCAMFAFAEYAQDKLYRRFKSADEQISFDTSSTWLTGRNKKAL